MVKKKSWKQVYTGNFLKSSDLSRDGEKFSIEGIEEKVIRKGEASKLIATLKGGKAWVLNATNCEVLEELFGTDDPDAWVGEEVCLFNDRSVRGPNGEKGGVRIMPERGKKAAKPKGKAEDDDDDDVDADLDDLDEDD